jgi:hypothetical protein
MKKSSKNKTGLNILIEDVFNGSITKTISSNGMES